MVLYIFSIFTQVMRERSKVTEMGDGQFFDTKYQFIIQVIS